MTDETSRIELGRLRWQCRRGMKELDIVLNRYLDRQYPSADAAERLAFLAVLEQEDPVLWAWVLGAEPIPEGAVGNVIRKLCLAP